MPGIVLAPASCAPQFNFAYTAEDEKNSLALRFARRTETMPQPPQVGRQGVELSCRAVPVCLAREGHPSFIPASLFHPNNPATELPTTRTPRHPPALHPIALLCRASNP